MLLASLVFWFGFFCGGEEGGKGKEGCVVDGFWVRDYWFRGWWLWYMRGGKGLSGRCQVLYRIWGVREGT